MASIQQSLNQLFNTTLAASFTALNNPVISNLREEKELDRLLAGKEQVAANAVNTEKAITELFGAIDDNEAKKAITQAGITTAEAEAEAAELNKARAETYLKHGRKKIKMNVKAFGDDEGITLKAKPSAAVNAARTRVAAAKSKLEKAYEAKQGVQEAVKERKSLLKQLKAQGINVDNPSVRIREVNK